MLVKEIEELVYEYGDDLYRYCYHLTSNKELADELYQETFLKAVQLSHRLNRSGNCKNYLIGIAINIWRNLFRKKKRRNEILPEMDYSDYIESVTTDGSDILEDYIHKELTDKVKLLVAGLPEKQRIVVLLFYSESLSTEEISKILHIPKGTVLSRLPNARERIRKELEEMGYEV